MKAKYFISFVLLLLVFTGCAQTQQQASGQTQAEYNECVADCMARSDYPANEKCPETCRK